MSDRYEQRERILTLRADILERLARGMSIKKMAHELGLDDIPQASLYRNVAILRKEKHPGVEKTVRNDVADAVQDRSDLPADDEVSTTDRPKSTAKIRRKKKGRGPIVHPDFGLPGDRDAKTEEPPTLKPEDYI